MGPFHVFVAVGGLVATQPMPGQGGPPPGPPFLYELDGTCYDLDDDGRLAAGLVAARVIAGALTGSATSAAVDILSTQLDAYQLAFYECLEDGTAADELRERTAAFSASPGNAMAFDVSQDHLLGDFFSGRLGDLRGAAKYARHLHTLRISWQNALAEALQRSVDCRVLARSAADPATCTHDMVAFLEDWGSSWTEQLQTLAPMADSRGERIDANLKSRTAKVTRIEQLMIALTDTHTMIDRDLRPALASMQGLTLEASELDLIPSLQASIAQLQDQAAAMDEEVTTLEAQIRALDAQISNETRSLVSGVL